LNHRDQDLATSKQKNDGIQSRRFGFGSNTSNKAITQWRPNAK
jgi:hypothetical protein